MENNIIICRKYFIAVEDENGQESYSVKYVNETVDGHKNFVEFLKNQVGDNVKFIDSVYLHEIHIDKTIDVKNEYVKKEVEKNEEV